MPPVDLGAGWALDEYWDFTIGSNGDFSSSDGIDELTKDLAFNIEPAVSSYLGVALSRGDLRDIQIDVVGVFEDDPRIDTIDSLAIEQTEPDTVVITVSATTVGEDDNLEDVVIPVTS